MLLREIRSQAKAILFPRYTPRTDLLELLLPGILRGGVLPRELEVARVQRVALGRHRVADLQDARYVIKSVICDPNFERLVLGCIESDFCK